MIAVAASNFWSNVESGGNGSSDDSSDDGTGDGTHHSADGGTHHGIHDGTARMTKIADILAEGRTTSFEFFPPTTEAGLETLNDTVAELASIPPSFVSVTYGAGGTNRDRTLEIVTQINNAQPYPAMPHLTCIGHTTAELTDLVDGYVAAGIDNMLALAGDPPADGSPAVGDYTYASELIELIRSRADVSIGVAAFPEGHPRSTSLADDRKRLAEKLHLADFGITQFFFRADDYLAMVDDLFALDCEVPVLPGLMPMLNPSAVKRFAGMNGAWFDEALAARVEEADEADRLAIAADAAAEMGNELLAAGAPGLHIYCMNRSSTALAVLERITED